MIINYPYQTQQVRDLAWACFSPALLHLEQIADASTGITGCALQLNPERRKWLQQLDCDPAALLEHLSQQPTHRLGIYFEQLWHFFLQQDPATDLIAHNLAVVDRGKTVGEFDCIYYDHQRARHVHLELAVKYYLGLQRSITNDARGHAFEWVGPDNRDRLATKLEHLLQHQVVLGENPAATHRLHELGLGPLHREVAFKGYLFQPLCAAPPPPVGYNLSCRLSHWVSCAQLLSYCTILSTHTFMVLPKLQWLCAARSLDSGEALNAQQLHALVVDDFECSTYPLLIAAMNEQGAEFARFFVTPEHWPLNAGHEESVRYSSPLA